MKSIKEKINWPKPIPIKKVNSSSIDKKLNWPKLIKKRKRETDSYLLIKIQEKKPLMW